MPQQVTRYDAFNPALLLDAIQSGWEPKVGSWGSFTIHTVLHNKKFGVIRFVISLSVTGGDIFNFVTINRDNSFVEASCFVPIP